MVLPRGEAMRESNPIAQLNTDHRNFAQLLDVFEIQLDHALDPDIKTDFPLMRDVMLYMTRYPDQFHHPKEDLLFTALVIRDRSIRAVVEELREAHRELATQGLALLETLGNVVAGGLVRRETLERQGRGYLELLRSHMNTEEGLAFRRAEQFLRDEDWVVIEREIEYMNDPLFGDVVHEDCRNLLDFIMRESE